MANALTRFISRLFGGKDFKQISERLSQDDSPDLPAKDAFFGKPQAFSMESPQSYNTGGDGSKWDFGLSATGSSPFLNHWLLRQNARSAYHDTSQARALVERFADTVVETGITLDPAPITNMLGITPKEARSWSDNVRQRFDLWAKDKKCSRMEHENFYQMQRNAAIFQQRDGEYFCRFMYSDKKDLQNPLQLQFLDPNQIRGAEFTSTYGFNEQTNYGFDKHTQDGIVRDKNGKEIGYKVWIRKPNKHAAGWIAFEEKTIPAKGPKSKRQMMVHGYQPEYAGQGRGYSRLSHAIQDFENLTDFTSAEIKKAIIQSCITMYTKPSKDAPASNPLEDISVNRPAGPTAGLATATVDGTPVSAQTQSVRYEPIPEASFGVPGSAAVFGLQEGEDLKPFANTAPAESFAKFLEAFVTHLCAGNSMPIEVLLMKFGQNYSASRGALVLFWRVVTIWRAEMEADFLGPVYEAWLSGEIAAGRISAPGWQDPRLRRAWLNTQWIGAPMPHIDPLREGKGKEIMVRLGALTLDRLAQEFNGSDGRDNREKLAQQIPELTMLPFEQAASWGTREDMDGEDGDDDDNE